MICNNCNDCAYLEHKFTQKELNEPSENCCYCMKKLKVEDYTK